MIRPFPVSGSRNKSQRLVTVRYLLGNCFRRNGTASLLTWPPIPVWGVKAVLGVLPEPLCQIYRSSLQECSLRIPTVPVVKQFGEPVSVGLRPEQGELPEEKGQKSNRRVEELHLWAE